MSKFTQLIKETIKRTPFLGEVCVKLLVKRFPGSEKYWIERYEKGGNSGQGSYREFSEFKAQVLNSFVKKNQIRSVIEYGCGDGNQLKLAMYKDYKGFDVSASAISLCKDLFKNDKSKSFELIDNYKGEIAELTLSLDVIYHLVENEIFESYMKRLFNSSERFVIIYSSNTDSQEKVQPPHVRHRKFTDWINKKIKGWELIDQIPGLYRNNDEEKNKIFLADFYIYRKK